MSFEKRWTIMGISAGVFVGGLVLARVARSKGRNTAEIYNGGLPYPDQEDTGIILDVGFTRNGAGLIVSF